MASVIPLSNLTEILSRLSDFVYVITGNEGEKVFNTHVHGYSINYHPSPHMLARIVGYIALQTKIVNCVIRANKKMDLCVIFMGDGLLIPMLFCKLMRKPVILILASSSEKMLEKNRDLLSRLAVLMEKENYQFADKIVVYSSKLVEEWGLVQYRHKILVAPNHYLDFDMFKTITQLTRRANLVGYIGRLSEEKGIINFVDSIPIILKNEDKINFLIGGDGILKNDVEKKLNTQNLSKNVKLEGWISHDDLPLYFNKLKLLVIPSYTEGLPNVMIEAMACGTPVLAAPVGAIPDFIKDGETGFIMENNSPDCVAENVLRAIRHPYLGGIGSNGRRLVEREFTFENAVKKFKEIFDTL